MAFEWFWVQCFGCTVGGAASHCSAMGDFKKLRVWVDACRFADRVEQMARELPQPDRGWAFNQLVPAAHSIHENLAEGWGFDSEPQKLKFCGQALSTGNESEDELLALERKGFLQSAFATLPKEARSVCAQLATLKMRIEESVARSRARRRRPVTRRRPKNADSREPAPETESPQPSREPPGREL
jgi:four helix bundle protein